MNFMQPFAPHYGSTQSLAAAAAGPSANVLLSAQDQQVRILNTGANVAYIRTGEGTQVATAADFPVAPGQSATITKGVTHNNLAYISPAGSTLVVSTGNGF